MNEHLKELAKQAGLQDEMFPLEEWDNPELEKFAELIIQECINISDSLSKLYDNKRSAFDIGYTMGTTRVSETIKKRFGIQNAV